MLIDAAGHGMRLVGWGRSVPVGGHVRAVQDCYRDWYPVEVRRGQPAGPATDLLLAAKCLVYLAGGGTESRGSDCKCRQLSGSAACLGHGDLLLFVPSAGSIEATVGAMHLFLWQSDATDWLRSGTFYR